MFVAVDVADAAAVTILIRVVGIEFSVNAVGIVPVAMAAEKDSTTFVAIFEALV